MKKTFVSAFAVAVLAGYSSFVGTAWGEAPAAAAPRAAAPAANKIGLIDMAHVFKNYKKFDVMRQELKAEIDQSDALAKEKATQIKSVQEELKAFKDGTPEFSQREKQLTELTTEFESFRKVQQREFLRKEAAIYKTCYLEATDLVERYATHYQYTLIMRFNREGLESADDPQSVIQRMNKTVIHHAPDCDITDIILNELNKRYQQVSGTTAAPTNNRSASNPAAPAGGGRRQ